MGAFKSKKKNTWMGIALGVTGGLAGAWLMNQSQSMMEKIAKNAANGAAAGGAEGQGQGEPATVLTAEKISESVMGIPLPAEKKKMAEPLVHYKFGALVGALYGGLAAKAPKITLGPGTIYGAAVWLLADELAVPAFGLSGPPRRYPLSKHLQALGAHLVYGLTAEGVRLAGSKLAS